jgi:hypothetical protein
MKRATVPVGEIVRGFVAGVIGTKEPSGRLLRDLAAAVRTLAQAPAANTIAVPATKPPARKPPPLVCKRCGRQGHANARDVRCPKRQPTTREAGSKPAAAKPPESGDKEDEPPTVAPASAPTPTLPAPLPAPLASQRKCSPFPRARSYSLTKTARRWEAQGKLKGTYQRNEQLPATRGDCKDGPRPCPILTCVHHMALSVSPENGAVKEHYPHLRIWKEPEGPGLEQLEAMYGSCSLDIADEADPNGDGGMAGLLELFKTAVSGKPIGQTEGYTLEQTAKRMGISLERTRQIGAKALQEVRVALRRAGITDGQMPEPPRHPLTVIEETHGERHHIGVAALGKLMSSRLRERYPEREEAVRAAQAGGPMASRRRLRVVG